MVSLISIYEIINPTRANPQIQTSEPIRFQINQRCY